MLVPSSRDSGTLWTAIQLEYGVNEQCEQDTRRMAPAIWSPALQDEQRASGGVHARDLAGNASMDHPEGLAEKGQIAPSLRRARGVRGGWRAWCYRQAIGRLILLREAPEKRGIGRVRSVCFPLEVKRQKKEWPERQERRVKWLSASKAAEKVKDPALSKIIQRVARKYA